MRIEETPFRSSSGPPNVDPPLAKACEAADPELAAMPRRTRSQAGDRYGRNHCADAALDPARGGFTDERIQRLGQSLRDRNGYPPPAARLTVQAAKRADTLARGSPVITMIRSRACPALTPRREALRRASRSRTHPS